MNARQKKLLKILINEEDYISVDQLMDQLAVSKRTVHNDLCKVEDFLSDYHIELKRKSNCAINKKEAICDFKFSRIKPSRLPCSINEAIYPAL